MSLIPKTSLSKLAGLRGRERIFHVVWGLVRWMAFALTLFVCAAMGDYWIDRYRETPMWARVLMMAAQAFAFSVAALFWIVLPGIKGQSLIRLAKRVEEQIPEFDHRLVTSIQLTRRNARVAGMSPQLIRMVSEEAETISRKHDLKGLADTRRLKWSLALLAWPLGILAFMLIYFKPPLLMILLKRQLLTHVDIPRDVSMTTATRPNPWPAGSEVIVSYVVKSKNGKLDKEMKGTLIYTSSENNQTEECELAWDNHTEFKADEAIFTAKVPHSSQNFNYRARIGDGRTHGIDEVIFEPRPQVTLESVWVQAPGYVAGRPEVQHSGGDILARNGSRARVRISVQKPITEAFLELYQLDSANRKDVLVRKLPMEILPPTTGNAGDIRYPAELPDYFDLNVARNGSRLSSYKIAVKDKYGFANAQSPQGIITITHPPLPVVTLLRENEIERGKPKNEEDFHEVMPLPLGGKFRVEYVCHSDIGICTPYHRGPEESNKLIEPAMFVYQVNDGPLNYLPLTEVPETPETGEYDLQNATFANKQYQAQALKNQVRFHAKPAHEPGEVPRQWGGGFFEIGMDDLKKVGLDGKPANLALDDRISFWIEIYDCDPAVDRPPGKSEIRVKTVATNAQVTQAFIEDQRRRTEELKKRQEAISARAREKE